MAPPAPPCVTNTCVATDIMEFPRPGVIVLHDQSCPVRGLRTGCPTLQASSFSEVPAVQVQEDAL